MPDKCNLVLKISRADFNACKLAAFGFRIDKDYGSILEVSHCEASRGGRELREKLEAEEIVFLGLHDTAADYGCAAFACDGLTHLQVETDRDGTYLVPASKEGIVDEYHVAALRKFVALRKRVVNMLGLCPCCEVPLDRCRMSRRSPAIHLPKGAS